MDEENKKAKRLPAKSSLILRIAAGAYLLYLDYGIKDSIFQGTGTRQMVFAGFGVLFLAAGVLLIAASVRSLAAGQYQGGAGDAEDRKL